MKTKNFLLFLPLLILFICSCNKESLNEKIVGKWQIQERYDGYAMGGTYGRAFLHNTSIISNLMPMAILLKTIGILVNVWALILW